MQQNDISWLDLLVYAIAMTAGGVGGAGAASLAALRGRPVTLMFVLAYIALGAVLGAVSVGMDVALTSFGLHSLSGAGQDDGGLIHRALLFGFAGTATLAGLNLGIARIFKGRGWSVDVRFDQPRVRTDGHEP